MSISRRTFFTFYINYVSIAFYAVYIICLVTPGNLDALAYYTILNLNGFVKLLYRSEVGGRMRDLFQGFLGPMPENV